MLDKLLNNKPLGITLLLTALAVVLLLTWRALTHDAPGYSIQRYCQYGAVSQAQLAGCESHVTVAQIKARHTNAALYSNYRLTGCLQDAGPFCADGP